MKFLKLSAFLMLVSMVTFSFVILNQVKVDTAASEVTWQGYKITGSHTGTIDLKSGSFEIKDDKIVGGEFVLDMNTIKNTDMAGSGGAAKLEGHLKSDDFFGVEKYPTANFKVKSASPAKMERSFNISGDVTIKGKTNPITFVAQMENTKEGVICTAQLKVDRTVYDVKYGSGKFFDGLGDKMIYDEFDINIRLVGDK